jgi:hypothetical protein
MYYIGIYYWYVGIYYIGIFYWYIGSNLSYKLCVSIFIAVQEELSNLESGVHLTGTAQLQPLRAAPKIKIKKKQVL